MCNPQPTFPVRAYTLSATWAKTDRRGEMRHLNLSLELLDQSVMIPLLPRVLTLMFPGSCGVPRPSGSRSCIHGIMSSLSAAGVGRGARFRRGRVSRRGSGGMILAVALFVCGYHSSSGLLAGATGATPVSRLAEDGSSITDGGDGGFPVAHHRVFLGDGHPAKYSRFPVLPGAWMDGEAGRCHPASPIYTWKKWGIGSNINRE